MKISCRLNDVSWYVNVRKDLLFWNEDNQKCYIDADWF
jgi:hypothetical protein